MKRRCYWTPFHPVWPHSSSGDDILLFETEDADMSEEEILREAKQELLAQGGDDMSYASPGYFYIDDEEEAQ